MKNDNELSKGGQYSRYWRKKNPDKYKVLAKLSTQKRFADPAQRAKHQEWHRNRQREISKYCQSLKAITPCKDCHRIDLYYLMDFDHREGTNNRAPQSCRTWNEVNKELEKCDIVCVRCHRIRTYTRRLVSVAKAD